MAQAQSNFDALLKKQLRELPNNVAVLLPLYEACRAAIDAMQGVANMPRADKADDVLDREIEAMSDRACAVAVKLANLASIDEFWKELYLETMLSHHFFVGGNAAGALNVLGAFQNMRLTKRTDVH